MPQTAYGPALFSNPLTRWLLQRMHTSTFYIWVVVYALAVFANLMGCLWWFVAELEGKKINRINRICDRRRWLLPPAWGRSCQVPAPPAPPGPLPMQAWRTRGQRPSPTGATSPPTPAAPPDGPPPCTLQSPR
jgi:hypothetical protein